MEANNGLLIISWNINGYTQDVHNRLIQFINEHRPEVIFLSETKRSEDVLKRMFEQLVNYNYIINSHTPAHIHGVAMLIRKNNIYQHVPVVMGISTRSDNKGVEAANGRIILIALNSQFYLIGCYTPNSGRSDAVKLIYRTKVWDPAFLTLLQTLRSNGPTIWIGDVNVALTDIDVSNPKSMIKYAGFTLEERTNFGTILNNGWIDVFRYLHGQERLYTWRGDGGKRDYGMRLDNILVTDSLLNRVISTQAYEDIPLKTLSDHVMIGVTINRY